MSYNLFDLTLRVARALNAVEEGIATSGDTTSLIDSNNLTQDDDFWNGGTAWIIQDSAGAGAAPEGEYSIINDFANATGDATLRTTLSAGIASGDRYAIADNEYPLNDIISQINAALDDMGPVVFTDTTSVTIADNQTEYTLPTAIVGGELKEVWFQNDDSDSDDNRWTPVYNWYVQKTATGTADELILPYQFASGYDLKLVYTANHAELYDVTDKLSEDIDIRQVVYRATLNMLRYNKKKRKTGRYDDEILKYEQKVATLPSMMVRKPSKRRLILTTGGSIESEPDSVVLS